MADQQIFATDVGGPVIVLNLPRNRYFSIDRDIAAPVIGANPSATEAERSRAITAFQKVGLLHDGPPDGLRLDLTSYRTATKSLELSRRPFRPWRLARAGLCSMRADGLLRSQSLETIVADRTRNRDRLRSVAPDTVVVQRLALEFRAWRPTVSAGDRCLADSLALLLYLRDSGGEADWVFGVTAPFFRAHCWVQVGNTVLNDSVSNVSAYTPIMIV